MKPDKAKQGMFIGPAEVAKRFGVGIKALRLYEQRGLLKPVRSRETGWRAYGPDQIARLHQIIAMKRLGMSLMQIRGLLANVHGLDQVLAIQERILMRESEKLAGALAAVRAARAKLASGTVLSIDDLATLTKETVMNNLTDEERYALLKPISEKYFSEKDAALLKDRKYHQPAITAQWNGLFEEAKFFIAEGIDPTSPQAQNLAVRWNALIEQFTGGNEDLRNKVRAVWKEAMADPKLAPIIPLTPEVAAFMGKALEHMKRSKK